MRNSDSPEERLFNEDLEYKAMEERQARKLERARDDEDEMFEEDLTEPFIPPLVRAGEFKNFIKKFKK